MLEDLLEPGLNVVVCGTAAGHRSGRLGLYYAGRGNKFWRTLAEIGLTPRQLAPQEYGLLPGFGIGLTDLVKGQSGSDAQVMFASHGSFAPREKILRLQPAVLCFNGKRAAQVFLNRREIDYGILPERVGETCLFVAPSTSGAASGSWNISYWLELARVAKSSLA